MKGKFNFQQDLAVAQVTQQRIAEKLLELLQDSDLLSSDNNNNSYDIAVERRGTIITFELKEDFKSRETGNIFIEYSCNRKPSGIRTTKANFYILTVAPKDGTFEDYIIPTKVLKQMIDDELWFMEASGGDNGTAKGYLFKFNTITKHEKCLNF